MRTLRLKLCTERRYNAGIPIIKVIRNEILGYVRHGSCFETKYYAMNTLADVGILLKEKPLWSDDNGTFLSDVLTGALLTIGKMLSTDEAQRVIAELRAEPEFSSPSFLHDLEMFMMLDITAPGWISQYGPGYDNCKKVERLATKKRKGKKPNDYKSGLLGKILHIRWMETKCDTFWKSGHTNIEDLLELFLGFSVPFKHKQYLEKIDRSLSCAWMAGGPTNWMRLT